MPRAPQKTFQCRKRASTLPLPSRNVMKKRDFCLLVLQTTNLTKRGWSDIGEKNIPSNRTDRVREEKNKNVFNNTELISMVQGSTTTASSRWPTTPDGSTPARCRARKRRRQPNRNASRTAVRTSSRPGKDAYACCR